MKLNKNKYIKCFSKEKSDLLQESGFLFLYEKSGVYFHENNELIIKKFSNLDILNDTKMSAWIGL